MLQKLHIFRVILMGEVIAIRRGTNPTHTVHSIVDFAVTNIESVGICPLCLVPEIAKHAARLVIVYGVTARVKHPVFIAAFGKTATVKWPGITEKASAAAHCGLSAVDVAVARGLVIWTLDKLLYFLVLWHLVWRRGADG